MPHARTVAFADAHHRPTSRSILAALGPAAPAWTALFDQLHADQPGLTETWSYYADGGSWLLKVGDARRTVFWALVEHDAFRITFYFAERLTDALLDSALSASLKEELRATPPKGNLRAVSLRFDAAAAMKDALALVELKRTLR